MDELMIEIEKDLDAALAGGDAGWKELYEIAWRLLAVYRNKVVAQAKEIIALRRELEAARKDGEQ